LDGIAVEQAQITAGGSLAFDRQWALFDDQNRFVNGKRHAKIHRLRCRFHLGTGDIEIGVNSSELTRFNLTDDRAALETWLGGYFGFSVHLQQNVDQGFPDDTNAPGPTLLSEATLDQVAQWFPEWTSENMRLRFRANLEIADVPPFWEDQLCGAEGTSIGFTIGSVQFLGVNPCQRCIVPTRDPWTGANHPGFQKQFTNQRQSSLPPWAVTDRFKNAYRLSINTKILPSESEKWIQVGDPVQINHPLAAH
jgi:uncharacterized protein YcbX